MKKTASTKLAVQGMHCPACELLIERYLKKMPGVISVKASLKDKTVTIKTRTLLSAQVLLQYNRALEKDGYILRTQFTSQPEFDQQTVVNAVIILATLGLVVYFLHTSRLLAGFSLQANSSLWAFFGFGLLAGFSTCAALVGGLMLSFIKKGRSLILFNLGRLLGFVLLGAVLGLLGSAFQLSISVSAIIAVVVSLVIVVLGLQMLGVKQVASWRLQVPRAWSQTLSDSSRFRGRYLPAFAGVGTFFLPCGFTLTAQMLALSTGSWFLAGLMMLSFALGTLPSLLLLAFGSVGWQKHKTLGSTFNLVMGMVIVFLGLYNLNSQLLVLGLPNLQLLFRTKVTAQTGLNAQGLGSKVLVVNGQKQQLATIQATGFEYLPSHLKLKANIPTQLTVRAKAVLGCAASMYLKGLTDEVIYLNQPETLVSFVPKQGTYYISCSMGMVKPIEVQVN